MCKADNLPPSCAIVTKSGNLNFLEHSGSLQACNGTALPFLYCYVYVFLSYVYVFLFLYTCCMLFVLFCVLFVCKGVLITATGFKRNSFIHSLVFSLEGRAWLEPEPSHVTGMALALSFLGKFLGVVYHCFPLPLDVPTLAARCLRPQRRERS